MKVANILLHLSCLCGFEINFNFGIVYLGNIPTDLTNQDKYLLKILLVAGKKAITKKWLNKEPPTKTEWLVIVKEIYDMEKLTLTHRLCINQFQMYWLKWLSHE